MNRVIHFEVQADDIGRARKFYENAFGWEFKEYDMPEGQNMMKYWLIMTGKEGTPGIDGGMYVRPKDDKIFTYDCTIEVEDIDKAVEAVKANGGTITREKSELPGVGWFASAKDTEGNRFALMQAVGWNPK